MHKWQWQRTDQLLEAFRALVAARPFPSVLDVGCGVGQTLHALGAPVSAELVGIDISPGALALAVRLAERQGRRISFVRAPAHNLPFPGRSFTHVLCRNALTYMHQSRALAEMARVLQPGGYLYLQFESVYYDLSLLTRARGARDFAALLRDLACGVVNALVGWQVVPGRRYWAGRALATPGWVGRMLGRLGCRVLRVKPNPGSQKWLGIPTQIAVLAMRLPE
jgi:ubiquinone/menaquinone biosynthesis C-methylase UbiE